MPVTAAERLRQLLGEVVPPGGSADDTLFTDAAIQELVTTYPLNNDAIREGWKIKAAHYANLVNTNESGTSRSLSHLHDNALDMLKFYGGEIEESTEPGYVNNTGRTRIHKIVRL